MNTKFSKWDLLPIGAVLALAVALFLLFLPSGAPAAQVEIYQGGNLLTTLPLDKDTTYTVTGPYTNIVTVKDGKVAVTQSNCPGSDCTACGWAYPPEKPSSACPTDWKSGLWRTAMWISW